MPFLESRLPDLSVKHHLYLNMVFGAMTYPHYLPDAKKKGAICISDNWMAVNGIPRTWRFDKVFQASFPDVLGKFEGVFVMNRLTKPFYPSDWVRGLYKEAKAWLFKQTREEMVFIEGRATRGKGASKNITYVESDMYNVVRIDQTPVNVPELERLLAEKYTEEAASTSDSLKSGRMVTQYILDNLDEDGYFRHVYIQNKTGRLTATGISLQNAPKDVREAALLGKVFAYDVSVCQWDIMRQIGKKIGAETPVIDLFCSDKNAARQKLADECGISVKKAKQLSTSMIFGASVNFRFKDAQDQKEALAQNTSVYERLKTGRVTGQEYRDAMDSALECFMENDGVREDYEAFVEYSGVVQKEAKKKKKKKKKSMSPLARVIDRLSRKMLPFYRKTDEEKSVFLLMDKDWDTVRRVVESPMVKELESEMKTIAKEIISRLEIPGEAEKLGLDPKMLKRAKGGAQKKLCYILQNEEAKCLKALLHRDQDGRPEFDICFCVHDGWATLSDYDPSEFERVIKERTGYDLRVGRE